MYLHQPVFQVSRLDKYSYYYIWEKIMSVIQTTFSVTEKAWTQSEVAPTNVYTDLQFNVADGDVAEINHLNFGYTFSLNGETISEGRFPPAGTIETVKTTNVISDRINVLPNTTYQLYVWAENASDRSEKTFEITTPPPDRPYASWVWDGTTWVPPVPMPTDGPEDAAYKWSEKQQKWFLLVPPLTQFDDI